MEETSTETALRELVGRIEHHSCLVGVKIGLDDAIENASVALAAKDKELESLREDAQRMDWLDVGNRFVMRRVQDEVRSDHCVGMAVGFYVDGKYTVVDGDTVRQAIDKARKP